MRKKAKRQRTPGIVSDPKKRRAKRSFFCRSGLPVIQILLWLFMAAVCLLLGLWDTAYARSHPKEFWGMFLLAEALVSVTAPVTFARVKLSERCVRCVSLFLPVKRIAKEDIRQIGIFEKYGNRAQHRLVFFSGKERNVEEINRCFVTGRCRDIIFLDYPQKGLKEALQELFPDQFDESNVYIFSE